MVRVVKGPGKNFSRAARRAGQATSKADLVSRRIVLYALPMLGSQVVFLIGSTAALARLGHLGTDTLGAVAAPQILLGLAYAAFTGVSTGMMILVARAKAAGKTRDVERLLAQGLTIAVLCGVALGGLGAVFASEILRAANVAPSLLHLAVPYTQLISLYVPALFVYMTYVAVLQGLDDIVTPFAMLGVQTIIFLTLLVLLPLGALSVPIAALAATLLVTIVFAVYLGVRRPEFRLDVPPGAYIPDSKTFSEALRLDLPASVQYIAVALSDIAVVSIANGFGARGGASFIVILQIITYLLAPATVLATAASAFASQALGASRSEHAHSLRVTLLLYIGFGGALTIGVYVLAGPLLGIFLVDPQVLQTAKSGLFIVAWSAFALGLANVVCGELDAHGLNVWPMTASVAGVWLILVPCAVIFTAHVGIDGIWDAYSLAYAGIAITQIAAAPLLLRLRRAHEPVQTS